MPVQLTLTGGLVALPGSEGVEVDLAVEDGRIVAVCARGRAPAGDREIDCRGLVVLPGAIDAHVHLGDDIRLPRAGREAASETAAAATGGVTSMLVYLMDGGSYGPVVEQSRAVMDTSSVVDFGFHCCIGTDDQVSELPDLVGDLGVSSFKIFMSFRGSEGAYLGLPGVDDGLLYELLRSAAANSAMVNPHAENIEIVWRLRDAGGGELRRRAELGELAPLEAWNASRPPLVEAEAAQRVAFLAGETGASCFAVHTSCSAALAVLEAARSHGADVYIETCPHYLTHDRDGVLGGGHGAAGTDEGGRTGAPGEANWPPKGGIGKVNPPLRSAADRDALWAALASGSIDVVGSDHVPRPRAAKDKPVFEASAGFPGTETLLPVLLSEGWLAGRLPLSRVCEVVAERPARLFGCYPQKGVVQVGADADLAVVDPAAGRRVSAETVASAAGYSLYEGWTLAGPVRHTIVRGEVVVADGTPTGATPGRYLARSRSGRAALDASRRAGYSTGSRR